MTEPGAATRVLVADDHPLFRQGMKTLLSSIPDVEVVGEAATGEEAVALAAQLQPDVVLMDVQMPGTGGIDATRSIVGTSPHIRVLVVTMFEDDESVFAALRAGARGYVLKGARPEEVLRAIRAVESGEAIFSPNVAQRLVDFFAGSRASAPPPAFPELTEREREILLLISAGRSNGQIAQQLGINLKTVRNHVSNIFSKLQVTDRAHAILRAKGAGMGSP